MGGGYWSGKKRPDIGSLFRTHGESKTLRYRAWATMLNRCLNVNDKSYPNYGGRGITVCERWRKYEAFAADMGPRPSPAHSIERINNDGPYAPDNCRWATGREQQRNKRTSRFLKIQGEILTMAEWAERVGMNYFTLRGRLRNGWTPEDAIAAPVRPMVQRRRKGDS